MQNSNLNKNNHQYDYFRYLRTPPASQSILRCMFGMFIFDHHQIDLLILYLLVVMKIRKYSITHTKNKKSGKNGKKQCCKYFHFFFFSQCYSVLTLDRHNTDKKTNSISERICINRFPKNIYAFPSITMIQKISLLLVLNTQMSEEPRCFHA